MQPQSCDIKTLDLQGNWELIQSTANNWTRYGKCETSKINQKENPQKMLKFYNTQIKIEPETDLD